MFKVIAFITFLGCFIVTPIAQSRTTCSTTPLSPIEAKHLLKFIPQAITAKKAGGKLDVVNWNPGTSYRKDLFYFFFLLVNDKGMQKTVLNNGVIGYFAVNKIDGDVFEALVPSIIEDKVLMKMQAKIRTKHCIGKDLIEKYQDILPTK